MSHLGDYLRPDFWTEWEPSPHLRWIKQKQGETLQQKWVRTKIDGEDRVIDRSAEWRNVPSVEEGR
jgi:hypothetical protein